MARRRCRSRAASANPPAEEWPIEHRRVAIVGSGFAGTILARILHRLGVATVLLERHRHPRFAIGESSTPLAAICLERLARRYDLADLRWLAAYGRWMHHLPEVRRGLKRGFTFFRHRPGEPFRDTPDHEGRLLVAASPADDVADTHWLREDVDAFLVQRALAEGVDYRDETAIGAVERAAGGGWVLHGQRGGTPLSLRADVLVDGSGAGGLLAETLGLASPPDATALDTALVYAHFAGVRPLADLSPGPYPDERAAVHHLLREGWMYVLPFDHGVVSAGILLRRDAVADLAAGGGEDPAALWETVLSRYPSLARQFAAAVPVQPVRFMPRVQRRLDQAAGSDWALLPHSYAFLDPMFSTGIAWSLRGIERLALVLGAASRGDTWDADVVASGLARYAGSLGAEVRQMARLLEGAWLALDDFDVFTAQSFLYFATVSYQEVEERLFPDGRTGDPPAWQGFLGAGDATLEALFEDARQHLAAMSVTGPGETPEVARRRFSAWVTAAIRDRNVAGLADPARRNLYPVDLDLLVERAGLLGMTSAELRTKLPLLRGSA